MTEPHSNPAGGAGGGHGCNGLSLVLLPTAAAGGYFGWRYGAAHGPWWGLAGIAAGVLLGLAATPLTFLAVAAFAHGWIRIEDRLRRRDR